MLISKAVHFEGGWVVKLQNQILVLFHLEGAHIVVLKATDDEAWCRCAGCTCVSLSFRCRSEEKGEQRGGNYVVANMMNYLGLIVDSCVAVSSHRV